MRYILGHVCIPGCYDAADACLLELLMFLGCRQLIRRGQFIPMPQRERLEDDKGKCLPYGKHLQQITHVPDHVRAVTVAVRLHHLPLEAYPAAMKMHDR